MYYGLTNGWLIKVLGIRLFNNGNWIRLHQGYMETEVRNVVSWERVAELDVKMCQDFKVDYPEKLRKRILKRNYLKLNRIRLDPKSMIVDDDRTPTTTLPTALRAVNVARPRRLFGKTIATSILFPASDTRPMVREIEPCQKCNTELLKFLDSHGWVLALCS